MSKKTNIRTMIRKIVREEVAIAIQEVITELKQPSSQIRTKPVKKVVEGKRVYKKYTENSVLNDVLNETAQSEDWKTMNNEVYDSSKANEVISSQYGDLMNSKPSSNTMIASMGVNPDTVEDNVKDALGKDYSQLMKAISKKKGKM